MDNQLSYCRAEKIMLQLAMETPNNNSRLWKCREKSWIELSHINRSPPTSWNFGKSSLYQATSIYPDHLTQPVGKLSSCLLHSYDALKEKVKVESLAAQSCLTLCNPVDRRLPRLLCQWDFPGKNTGVDRHFLLQTIFTIQGLNPGLPHCRQMLSSLSHQGSFKGEI